MSTLLITTFAPYGPWPTNAAQETLRAWLARAGDQRGGHKVETATFPVHYQEAERQLETLRAADIDFTLLLGQSPGSDLPALETFALNLKADPQTPPQPLDPAGPQALRTELPLVDWQAEISAAGAEARVSFHAGTYLCNAVYYWSLRHDHSQGRTQASLFLHLPLLDEGQGLPGSRLETNVAVLELVVRQIERYLDSSG